MEETITFTGTLKILEVGGGAQAGEDGSAVKNTNLERVANFVLNLAIKMFQ